MMCSTSFSERDKRLDQGNEACRCEKVPEVIDRQFLREGADKLEQTLQVGAARLPAEADQLFAEAALHRRVIDRIDRGAYFFVGDARVVPAENRNGFVWIVVVLADDPRDGPVDDGYDLLIGGHFRIASPVRGTSAAASACFSSGA
jgi:hypothetical protein